MKKQTRGLVLAIVLLLGPAFVGPKADLPAAERTAYIEVHGSDIAYVPMTETHVKFNGEIRKIVRFTATVDKGRADCRCPDCCNGECYVIVYTDLVLPEGPVRTLRIIWLAC